MAIDFSAARWAQVRQNYQRWWAGELDRPLVPVILKGRDPGRPMPAAPLLGQGTCQDLTIPAADLIDRIDYELSGYEFLGDSFPHFFVDFGPGVMGAMLGARLDNSSGNVWYHPTEELPVERLKFRFDPENVWVRRVRELNQAGMRRWQGQVLLTMTDLGGNLDILSTFRPSEQLLLDLYDSPDEVKRLTWEAHEAWHQCYQYLNQDLQSCGPAYLDWSGIYSDRPNYILQCDFCYMISPAMFQEFVEPELVATLRRLGRGMYHLDGPGQLPHLDLLLAIPELDGIQWVPDIKAPDCGHYPDLYRRVKAAGKKIQVVWRGQFEALDAVIQQLGTGRGIHKTVIYKDRQEREDAVRWLKRLGVEP
ncbi:MAG: hypothetical protein WCI73_03355 [Phycisphaerae bacterium]